MIAGKTKEAAVGGEKQLIVSPAMEQRRMTLLLQVPSSPTKSGDLKYIFFDLPPPTPGESGRLEGGSERRGRLFVTPS